MSTGRRRLENRRYTELHRQGRLENRRYTGLARQGRLGNWRYGASLMGGQRRNVAPTFLSAR